VIIAPIKPLITVELGLEESKTPVAFMAVNDNFLKIGESRSAKRNLMKKIVVMGKVSNKFQRESYERLMAQIKKLNELPVQIELTFIGIDSQFCNTNMIDESSNIKIQILGHIEHENLSSKLSEFDIGIIPYSDNRYFRETFPLKTVEYAATKILIVASDTKTHKDILGDNAIYYDTQDENSLREVLSRIWNGEFNTEEKIESAYKWSQSKTYSKRVEIIMECALTVQNLQ
jgi:glycosyltransferase involved in cell wall biosynthesis